MIALIKNYLDYLVFSALVVGIAGALFLFGAGYERSNAEAEIANIQKMAEIDRANALKLQAEINDKNTKAAVQAAIDAQAEKQKTETVFKTIYEAVTEYVQATPSVLTCGLDDDGLRIWNSANTGAYSDDSKGGSITSN
jgi:hypothetical protein